MRRNFQKESIAKDSRRTFAFFLGLSFFPSLSFKMPKIKGDVR